MFNNYLLILPKSGITARRRAPRRRLVPFYGTEFSKPIGLTFAPIRHNWCYAFSPEVILKLLNESGQGAVRDTFNAVLMDENMMKAFKLPFTKKADPFANMFGDYETTLKAIETQVQVGAQDKDFVENFMPRLDAGLKMQSYFGSFQFLLLLLILGLNLGFNTKFFFYIISNILTTEAVSYGCSKVEFEVTGNSIFGYTNHMMNFMLFMKKGRASNWGLYIAVALAFLDFVTQFFVPAASKTLHFFGIGVGWLWAKYGYGLRLKM